MQLSDRYLLAAIACALLGMAAGIAMGLTHDFRLSPAHAHLNLLGWVTLALYGAYFRAVPRAGLSRAARVQFWLATIGVAMMAGPLAIALLGHREVEPLIGIGGFMVTGAMGVFGWIVWRTARVAAPAKAAATLPWAGTAR
ncbi:MAG: hypothetical protein K2X11_16160 [Acetobacteraceae bacterium]|nr:hypothetical protein [Acetobacteraceae bacterium]